jgi:hypothetical protein
LYELLFVEDKIIQMDSTFLPSEVNWDHTNQNIAFEIPKSSFDMQNRRLPRLKLDNCDDVNVGKSSEAGPSSSTSSQSSSNSKVTTNSKSTKKGGQNQNKNWIFGPDGTKLKRGKSMGNLGG